MSFPATFTRENFNSFPILITWLQFSTFLNGIIIGGLDACFQLTDPGEILSSTSSRTHLQMNFGKIQKLHAIKVILFLIEDLPGPYILKQIVHISWNSKAINP
jgi:hypothetical protein